jgi:hypothetical protein
MKAINSLVVLAALATSAHAEVDQLLGVLDDQIKQAWYRDSETRAWLLSDGASNGMKAAPCSETLMKLANLGVPAARVAKQKKACDAIEYHGKIKEVERWITMAAESDSVNNKAAFGHCLSMYDAAIAAGVNPSERVPQRKIRIGRELVMWSGTIEELKVKYCDAGKASIDEEVAKREAPFRKTLKNDKLAFALGHNVTASYVLAGGDASMNPAKLAAAKIWFDSTSAPSNEAQHCADGRRRTLVRRYEFDKEHRLVKTTTKEYCGEAVYR